MEVDSYRVKLAAVRQLEELKVPLTRLGAKQRKKIERVAAKSTRRAHKSVFGISLEVLLVRNGVWSEDVFVPSAVVKMAQTVRASIHTEGLFRVCGSAARMREAQHTLDRGGELSGTVHDAAGLLKLFFRELPEPLLTYRLYDAFVRAYRLPGPRQRAEAVLLLCLELPRANRHTLRFLLALLHEVAHSPASRMSAFNLAAIFTPNILKPEAGEEGSMSDVELQNHAACVGVVEFLVENHTLIGRVPPHVLRHAGEMPDEERARREYYRDVLGKRISWWVPRSHRKVASSHGRTRRLDSAVALEMIKGSELGIFDNGGSLQTGHNDAAAATDVFFKRPVTVWELPSEELATAPSTTTTTTTHGAADKKDKPPHSSLEDGPFGFAMPAYEPMQGFDDFAMY